MASSTHGGGSGQPLRFALVTTFYPPRHFGGDAVYVERLAEALVRRGHHVEVVCDDDAFRALSPGSGPVPEDGGASGIRVHRMSSAMPLLAALATHQLGRPLVHGRRIARILDEGRFDVIHYHNVSLVGGPAVLTYAPGAIKLYTMHEHWLVCPTHVLFRNNREPCPERACVRCALHYKRPPQPWRWSGLLERTIEHVDCFLSPSRFCAAKHRELGFRAPITVLPSFLPAGEADPALPSPPASPGEDGYLLFAGRLERIKGLHDFIPTFPANSPLELRIAGKGTCERELRHLAAGKRIRFLGHLDRGELARQMAGASALIACSAGWEVFPLVVLEAFQMGTPVLARRLGPLPEIVADSGAGLLFDSPAELAEAIKHLAREDGLRERLGARALAACRELWSEEIFLERYFGVIESLRERRRAAPVSRTAPSQSPVPATPALGDHS